MESRNIQFENNKIESDNACLDTDGMKEILLKMRSDILNDVKTNSNSSNEMGSDGVQDIGDVSANTYNRQILLSLNDSQRVMLSDIDEALDRIQAGEYGTCIECGDPISIRRLEVRPQARYCIECKTDIEKSQKM